MLGATKSYYLEPLTIQVQPLNCQKQNYDFAFKMFHCLISKGKEKRALLIAFLTEQLRTSA